MNSALAGQVAVVTGASSGIGRAAALRLANEGARIVAVGRDEKALDEVVVEVQAAGSRAVRVAVDLTDDAAPRQVVDGALAAFDAIDVLVNAAGVIAAAAVDATSDEVFDRMMRINVRAPFRLMREALPHIRKRPGAIVNVSSVNGLRAFPGVGAYCASKAAIDHLSRCAALDWAPLGVRVNCVNPGVTVTNLHRRGGMDEARYAEFLERAKTTHPLGRPGRAGEIAELIVFLASPASGWITGETIAIDGGRHLTCAR